MTSGDRRLAAVTEFAVILAFYQWYSAARHWVAGSEAAAYHNALQLVRVESAFGFFNEVAIQQWVLARDWLVQLLSLHYTTFHFAVPLVVLVVLFRRCPDRYLLYRNALGWTCALAVVVFWWWPLMPPRLLPGSYGFVDVFATEFRPPSVDHGFAPALYNGFAAMPSLHCAYALWCVVAVWPALRSHAGRVIVASHAAVTLLAVVATGNHFHLDAVGGAVVLMAGIALSRRRHRPYRLPTRRYLVGAGAALLGAALFIWIPKGLPMLAAQDLLVALLLGAAVLFRRSRRGRPEPATTPENTGELAQTTR